jgi:superfamily II DNA or RNA helicase
LKTYGQLELDTLARRWRIKDLAPHVAIAFKRMFPRVPVTSTEITISDTDEVRADLHWFMARYPLEHDSWGELDEAVDRLAFRTAERDRILLPTWKPGEVLGFKEGRAPYLYQTQASKVAIANGGLLLGDDVGLGKTISAIATMLMGAPMPAGVVVQPHLTGQWKKRIEEFSTLRVHVIKGRTPYDLPEADVYIYRYSNIAGWVDVLKDGLLRSVFYDEIQELRHGWGTDKGNACGKVSKVAQFRMGLTATPVYNYGDEMHSVMEYIKPDILGDREEFFREWCGRERVVANPDALGSYLRDTGFFLRRTEDDPTVDASMPPANVLEWELDYDLDAVAGEEEIMRQLAQTVLRASFTEAGRAARELDMKMRQLTGIAKAKSVAAYVSLLLKESPRVLLAGWHREVYSIWSQALAAFNPVLYTGSESGPAKQRSVDAFTTGDSRVMMMSLRSGAGLDGLQHYCQDAVIGEFDWSPQVHYQFIGRLRRPGQEGQVNAHYVHTNWGSDPVILEMLGIKADQSRGINDPGQAPKPRATDESRIKVLAQRVLDGGAA